MVRDCPASDVSPRHIYCDLADTVAAVDDVVYRVAEESRSRNTIAGHKIRNELSGDIPRITEIVPREPLRTTVSI